MAIQRRFGVNHRDVFPAGAYLVGPVEAVTDFQAPARPDGSRPQKSDPETGLLLWQVQVLDADEEAGKRDNTVNMKFLAAHQPVPPEPQSGFPFTLVQFVGLTALPYVDDSGSRPRIAWSFRAEGMQAPPSAGSSGSKAA